MNPTPPPLAANASRSTATWQTKGVYKMNEGARLANEEMFKKELLAKLDRIIVLLEKQQAVEHSVHLTGLQSPSAEELEKIIIRDWQVGA
jgi:hypothetical protein